MAVKLRLTRVGKTKQPQYRIVAADHKFAATGRFIERFGFYDPKAPTGRENFRVDGERLAFWQGKGARLTPTVARLVKSLGKPKAAAA